LPDSISPNIADIPAALPGVGDDQGKFASAAVRAGHVASHADLDIASVVRGHGNQCELEPLSGAP
jgi:hypothetical protein